MCGIFGYVGSRRDAATLVLTGLKRLEYRGYDSWGICVKSGAHAMVDKHVGKVQAAHTGLPESSVGLGHTRWATHGGVTDANAHPHLDCSARFAVVHNGIVANDAELRRSLSGHHFRSDTDTELIAHLVEEALSRTPEGPNQLAMATMAAFRCLRGLNAIAVLDAASGRLAAAKSGSPLCVGFAHGGYLLTSDHAALLEHTRRVAFVPDGGAVLLGGDVARSFDVETGAERAFATTNVEWTQGDSDLGGHPDYMTKEIQEQPQILRRLASSSASSVHELARLVERSGDAVAIGCGSGWHAALAAEYLFAKVGRRVIGVLGSEYAPRAQFAKPGSLVLAMSQSGETVDILEAASEARRRGATIAAVTNVPGSSLWRFADLVVPLAAGPERCVVSTKALTAQIAVVFLTIRALEGRSSEGAEALVLAAEDIQSLCRGERREGVRNVARAIFEREHLYAIGRGLSFPVALETALKIKEVSYLHAEGFAGGELKHGVIALIEPGTPCVVISPNDETLPDVLASAMQVRARGATIVGVGPAAHAAFDSFIEVADLDDASMIVSAVPAQLLGYDLALLRGCDPDMPRNLAKSVTVK